MYAFPAFKVDMYAQSYNFVRPYQEKKKELFIEKIIFFWKTQLMRRISIDKDLNEQLPKWK